MIIGREYADVEKSMVICWLYQELLVLKNEEDESKTEHENNFPRVEQATRGSRTAHKKGASCHACQDSPVDRQLVDHQ
jgi:hypothetical protein